MSEPSTSCSKQEDIETMSNYAESYLSDYEVDPEELRNQEMFEKPRGERRWLGKEHHRGKERLHNSVKDRTFIEKTVKATEPLSKNATKKINASTRDGLDFNVVYSLDKKNRWKTADTVSLLGATPENLHAEVVEKNALEGCEKSPVVIHSKQVNLSEEPGEFDIKTLKTTGKEQSFSSSQPITREFTKKANARMMTIRGQEQYSEKEPVSQPIISYNIYKTHPSQEVVGKQLFVPRIVSKSGRHRLTKKVDIESYDDDEYFDEEEEDESDDAFPQRSTQNVFDLSTLTVGQREKQLPKNKRHDSELSYDIVDSMESEGLYTNLLNIHDYLRNEGYMFENADVTFHNQKDNLEHQINELCEEPKLIVKSLKPRQYLFDVSKWCTLDGEIEDGETTAVIVFSQIRKNIYNVVVNSTIANHPSKKGSEYLRKQISSATSIREAITRITTEILFNRKVVETMKISTQLYEGKAVQELLHDCYEWENQLVNMQWPNQHCHATWANSEELSQVGGKLEWNDLCDMIRKETNKTTGNTSDAECGLCSQQKKSHELFIVDNESKINCTDCLKDEFYRELSAKRLPIDLQIGTADELECLPAFIPIAIVNLYVRMVSEIVYKDLGATGDFEKCPSCKSTVFFEELTVKNENKTQNRSCPCGYSWCKDCKQEPHWPMNCKTYAEWKNKWNLRYAMIHAQGSGAETLLQIACSCGRQIFTALLPVESIECPSCKLNVNVDTMQTFWRHQYFPFVARFRKLVVDGHNPFSGGWNGIPGANYHEKRYAPRMAVYSDISKIPAIKANVIEICGDARDIRYDEHFRNRAVNREHVLIRKNILDKEVVENMFGTSVYLVENVTAWMYMTNQSDKKVINTLEHIMENRKMLMKLLEGEDAERIVECVEKLRKSIDNVVSAVEKKMSIFEETL